MEQAIEEIRALMEAQPPLWGDYKRARAAVELAADGPDRERAKAKADEAEAEWFKNRRAVKAKLADLLGVSTGLIESTI